jgi:hypothetical protein
MKCKNLISFFILMMFSVIAFAADDIGGSDEGMEAISDFILMGVNVIGKISIFLGILFIIIVLTKVVRGSDHSSRGKTNIYTVLAVMFACGLLINLNLATQLISTTIIGSGTCIADTDISPPDSCYDYKSSEFMKGPVAEAIAKVKAEKGLKIEGYIELLIKAFSMIGLGYLVHAIVTLKKISDGTAPNNEKGVGGVLIQIFGCCLLMNLYYLIDSWIIPLIQKFTGPL